MNNTKQKIILFLVLMYAALGVYSIYYTYQLGISSDSSTTKEFVSNQITFNNLWHWGANLVLLIFAALLFVWRNKATIPVFGLLLLSVLCGNAISIYKVFTEAEINFGALSIRMALFSVLLTLLFYGGLFLYSVKVKKHGFYKNT